MAVTPPFDEVQRAVSLLSSGKAPGADGIHPEIIQHGGSKLLEARHEVIIIAWYAMAVPQDWKNTQLTALLKKGDRHVYGNYRGISLLSIPGKVFARILLNRSVKLAENVLLEAHSEFRP